MILLLSHTWHFHSGPLMEALERRGIPALRVNQDALDALTFALTPEGGAISLNGQRFPLSRITAVFAPKSVSVTPASDEQMDRWVAAERAAALRAMASRLSHARWLYQLHGGPDKLLQLQIARASGLSIPETLYSDDPEEVRAFIARHGEVVAKLHEALTQSMDGSGARVSTQALSAEDLEALDELAGCPMIFQDRVRKDYEIRAVVVGDRVFAARIALQDQQADEVVDWRYVGAPARWEAITLPGPAQEALVLTHRRLGLNFGAVDLIARPDGELVFLETNPHGEWWMLQDAAGLPIIEAMVDFLVGVSP